MARIYDIEMLFADLERVLKANIPAKLTEITADKNDGISLAAIETDAYFFGGLTSKIANYNPLIVYGIMDLKADGIGDATSQRILGQIIVVYSDDGNDEYAMKKLLRYQRALKEVLEQNWSGVSLVGNLSIEGIAPDVAQLHFRNGMDHIIGVSFEANIC